MTDPTNYFGMQQQVAPVQSFGQGFQLGDAILKEQMARQTQALQLKQAQDMQNDFNAVAANPTTDGITQLSIKYPQVADKLSSSFKNLDTKQQQNKLDAVVPIYAATASGKPDIAIDLLTKHIDALTNSGDTKGAQGAQTFLDMLKNNPAHAQVIMGSMLSGAMGPDKFQSTFTGLGAESRAENKAPLELEGKVSDNKKSAAEAIKAEVDANNAQPLADANLEKAQSEATTAGITADNASQKQNLDMQSTQANIDESQAKTNASNVKTDLISQQDTDNGLVDLGLPKPKRLPWANVKDAKQKAMLQSRVYSAAEASLSKEREEVIAKNGVSQDTSRFLELNSKIPTGGLSDKYALGQWAQSFGSDYSEMQAITAKLVPLMRAPGSGSTSDFDAKMFKQGTVGVDKPKATNESIATALIARAKQADDYVTFKQDYLQQNGTLQGADQYWKEYANNNPIFDPKKPNSFTLNKNRKSYQDYFATNSPVTKTETNTELKASPAIAAKAKQLGWSNDQLQQFLRDHS
jgi:hypothetical protein